MKFKIREIELANQVVLAPMAGISNSAYRQIIKEMGAGLVYAEMVSDKAIVFENAKTLDMLRMTEKERPIVQQIFGSDIKSFVEAARQIEQIMQPDIIDINMGCPVPKVAIKNQAGSSLLKDLNKIKEIVSQVASAVKVPVTVKIRSGWDEKSINAVEVARVCEQAGASAIAIHARARSQGYSGKADLEIIKQVKEAVRIPVIGNGDIKTCYQAKEMLSYTKCDAVMIGRGCLGNPWLIKECVDYLDLNLEPNVVSRQEKVRMMRYHLELLKEYQPEKLVMIEIRSQFLWYLKGLSHSKKIKEQICHCQNYFEMAQILDELETFKD